MEAPGIENDQRPTPGTIEQQSGSIGTEADPANVSDRASKCAIVRGDVTESSEPYELSNVGAGASCGSGRAHVEAHVFERPTDTIVVIEPVGPQHVRGEVDLPILFRGDRDS